MITKLTGKLVRVLDEEIRLSVGPYEYQVLVPEAVRRQIQTRTGEELTLHISEYLESQNNGGRFVPRMIGFLHETELEFFELFCTVEKIGVKKALKALARPIKEIADAISRQDPKWLATLPGIGAATAEQIVTTLKRKVTKFAFASDVAASGIAPTADGVSAQVVEDVYGGLMTLGMSPLDARARIDQLLVSGKPFANVEDALKLIFAR
ncbi:helix-hairpin-helix domain-containing protein [soil metagenome]